MTGSRPRDEIADGLRSVHVARQGRRGRHFVIYRTAGGDTIEVVRILHDGMNLPRHIPRDDRSLYEHLTREMFQAGLSWLTILRKREAFRAAFDRSDPARVAADGHADRARLLADAGIVRNRLEIDAAIHKAAIVRDLGRGHGSFAAWLDRASADGASGTRARTVGDARRADVPPHRRRDHERVPALVRRPAGRPRANLLQAQWSVVGAQLSDCQFTVLSRLATSRELPAASRRPVMYASTTAGAMTDRRGRSADRR